MAKKICGIYMIRNIINDKKYIGQSIDIKSRWYFHVHYLNESNISRHNEHLQNSWNKYGEENFEFLIIEKLPEDRRLLTERENFWITFYQTKNREFGYNKRDGEDSGFSEETRKKMSVLRKGKPKSEKFKENLRKILSGSGNPFFGKKHSPDVIQKNKESHKGENHNNYGKKGKMATSKYFGVCFAKKIEKWISSIKIDGVSKVISRSLNEEDAAMKYDLFILENNLKNSLNFPNKIDDYRELIKNGN